MKQIDRRFKINGIDGDYRLVFYSTGINRYQTAEESIEQLLQDVDEDDIEEIEEIKGIDYDDFEQVNFAVYKGDDGNIIIFEGSAFESEMDDGETAPGISLMVECAREWFEKPLSENKHLIIYVSQCYGTTIDYDFVLDKKLYTKINKIDMYSIIPGEVATYIHNAKARAKGNNSWKYGIIKNGKYSKL